MKRVFFLVLVLMGLLGGFCWAETKASDYVQAAQAGDAEAQCSLAACYSNGDGVDKDYKQAVYWFGKSAEQGDVDAKAQLEKL